MRRTKLPLLTLLIFLSSFSSFAQDFEYQGIWYTVLNSDAKTVKTKSGSYDYELQTYIPGNNCSGDVTIPSTVSDGTNEYAVTNIGDCAFSGCSSLTYINIPDGVTSIGESAFDGCSSLTSINIPDGVTSIEFGAFWGCSSLTSINIPDGVTSIGEYAFSGCSSLTSINIPDGVTSIREYAFSGCSSLTSINIPDGVTSIGVHAFDGCSSLTSINIPDGVTSIGEYAFFKCVQLEEITYNASTLIEAPENVFDSYIYGNTNLNTPNATLAAVQATLPWNLFKQVIASDGSIGINLALGEQFNIDGVLYTVIDEENHLIETAAGTSIEEGAINFSGDLVLSSPIVYNNISYTITEIGDYSFSGSDHLISVTIPASIVKIGENAFAECERLTSVIWQGNTRLQSGVVESIANPNLLVYVNSASSAPEGLDHNIVVMNTDDGIPSCDNLILEKGYAFHPAIDFVSQNSKMTQDYTQSTIIGQSAGWETIVLPFDAVSIYSDKQGELTPFAAVTNLEIQYPFWLYEADSQYEWKEASTIKAGVPYIISMPNNPDYLEDFNIDGPVTFACSEPALITGAIASPYAVTWTSGQDFSLMWLPIETSQAANAMGLNVGIDNATDENGELLPPGSAFIQGVIPRPLDAFVTRTGAARIKKVIEDHSGVLALRGDNGFEIKNADGEIILRSDADRKVDIFSIDGTHIRSITLRAGVSETLRDITPGIYLIAGVKVMVK